MLANQEGGNADGTVEFEHACASAEGRRFYVKGDPPPSTEPQEPSWYISGSQQQASRSKTITLGSLDVTSAAAAVGATMAAIDRLAAHLKRN